MSDWSFEKIKFGPTEGNNAREISAQGADASTGESYCACMAPVLASLLDQQRTIIEYLNTHSEFKQKVIHEAIASYC